MKPAGFIVLVLTFLVPALQAQTTCAEVPQIIVLLTLEKSPGNVFVVKDLVQAGDYSINPSAFTIGTDQTIATLSWLQTGIEVRLGKGLPQYLRLPPNRGQQIPEGQFMIRLARSRDLGPLMSTTLCGQRAVEGTLTLQRGLYAVNQGVASLPVSMNSRQN